MIIVGALLKLIIFFFFKANGIVIFVHVHTHITVYVNDLSQSSLVLLRCRDLCLSKQLWD